MKAWLVETIDQIALGEFLANSKLSCGQRFGLIAVDNAVESMLVAYIELKEQLVAEPEPRGIKRKDWDEVKRAFPKLLSYVMMKQTNLISLEGEINRYHDLRSNLYHTGQPITIRPQLVNEYSKLARNVLKILFDISFSPEEWDETLSSVGSTLTSRNAMKSIKRTVSFEEVDELVKFTTSELPSTKESVVLCLYGYQIMATSLPSRSQLIKSLAKSRCVIGPKALNARLHDLRKDGWINEKNLGLKQKGIRGLSEKYLFSS